MGRQPSPEFDYDAYYAQFTKRFLAALAETLPQVHAAAFAIREETERYLANNSDLVVDEASRANLRLGALVLACYQVLHQSASREHLLDALRDAFTRPDRQAVLDGTRAMLDASVDAFGAIVATSKQRQADVFGQSFTFELPQDDRFAYLVNISRCLWHTFFVRNGVPELTLVFCAFDANWIDAIEPARHGFRFERPTTLGWGGDRCRFWHIRTETRPKD